MRHGAAAFEDPTLFAEVERLLRASIDAGDSHALIVPELLGEPASWRLETAMKYGSHRPQAPAAVVQFVKRRLLMPMLRWLFEYSRDNFERQRRVNQVLFACVQELALETARLRRELARRRSLSPARRARDRDDAAVKLACVVQRYGAGVAGGSERHCRELALRLAAHHDVTILTTCAADYVTWENEFPAGVVGGRRRRCAAFRCGSRDA